MKVKSKLSSVLLGSRNAACLRRRSSSRSLRRVSSSATRQDQIDRWHGFRVGLVQPGFQHSGHAAEPELSLGHALVR